MERRAKKRGAPGAAVTEEENWAARKTDRRMVSQYLSAQPGVVRSAYSPEVPSPNSSLERTCEPRGNTFFFSGRGNG
jgi:hypothetical protein